ncbi:MAG: squalene/phytoene synthase family protein [Elusimicrobiota bacterium]|jgi:phytoene synthase|nr:squalene/phytoene synthase family protein [Elusimicrobiota bacterium]
MEQFISYKKSNFGGAFFFLDKEQKAALGAVYAFCRAADDIVDDGLPDAAARLAALREGIENIFAGRANNAPELAAAIGKYKLPKIYFTDLLDGMASDLRAQVRFKTYEDLHWYMYRAAGVVGLMCVEIFCCKSPRSHAYAAALGEAVQFTNILRDIEEDAAAGRLYIPEEDLRKFKLTQTDLLQPAVSAPRLAPLMAFEFERARGLYARAAALLPKKDFAALLPARAMGNIYRAVLEKLQKTPCRFNGKKVKLSKLEKLYILYQTWRAKP